MGLIPENSIVKAIIEYFGDDFRGMTGTDDSITIALKYKEITINNIKIKSIDEIIEEIKQSI